MIYLGDYIGHILGELTLARAQADGETVRLAEFYADHELLKHFPVPRLRIQDIQLDISVLVVDVEDSVGESGPRGGPSPADTALVFDSIVDTHFASLQLTAEKKNQIRGAIAIQYQILKRRRGMGLDAGGLAERLTKTLSAELKTLNVPEDKRKTIRDSVRAEAKVELQLKAVDPARIRVGVKSSEIRDANPESLLRITIKITEEAVEWSILDQDQGKSILTPE